MLTQRKHLILTAIAILATRFIASSQARGDEGLIRARDNVERKERTILFCMHPTCTLDSVKYMGKVEGKNTFGYTYHFTGALGGKWESTLYFNYDAQGKITGIEKGYTSTWTGQFTATDAVISWARNWAKNDESLKKNAMLMAVIDRADAKGLLLMLLK